jgi:hypothetical protein
MAGDAKVDLDDYNPFDNKTTASPAVMTLPIEEPNLPTKTAPSKPPQQEQISTADFQVVNKCNFVLRIYLKRLQIAHIFALFHFRNSRYTIEIFWII